MFKKFALFGLLAVLSTPAFATDTTATVKVESENIYRGQTVSDEVSAGLNLRFDDVLVNGLFLTGDFSTTDFTPTNDSLRFRSDVGVGYGLTLSGVTVETSLNRVLNPVIYSGDYTEFRARAAYGYGFVEFGQGLTSGVNRDTYLAIGAEAQFTKRFSGKALVSGYSYDLNDHPRIVGCGSLSGCEWALWSDGRSTRFNNVEVSGRYNLWRDLDVFASYSEGGRNADGSEIKNQFWGGFQYRF